MLIDKKKKHEIQTKHYSGRRNNTGNPKTTAFWQIQACENPTFFKKAD